MLDKSQGSGSMAVVFTQFERTPPYSMLQQIDRVGIRDVYILLNNEEYQQAKDHKYRLLRWDENVLQHYQNYTTNPRITFHVINTGNTKGDEEKLKYYLEENKKNYIMNIFVVNESLPWVTTKLKSTHRSIKKEKTEYKFLGYSIYETISLKKKAFSLQPKSSPKALELLKIDTNPCYCHQRNKNYDDYNYQWLFNIFVELTLLEISLEKNDSSLGLDARYRISELVENYYQSINDLAKLEKDLEIMHAKVWSRDNIEEYYKGHNHRSYPALQAMIKKRDSIEEGVADIITNLKDLYLDMNQDRNPKFEQKK